MKRDDHVLIHTGASGVGVAANQLARFLGAYVFSFYTFSSLFIWCAGEL